MKNFARVFFSDVNAVRIFYLTITPVCIIVTNREGYYRLSFQFKITFYYSYVAIYSYRMKHIYVRSLSSTSTSYTESDDY